jgi:transcriptional regulator with XRE-family HTH domain
MIDLAAIRRATGLTQTELAANLGVGQAQISKVERQDDMLLSTLASYLKALGVTASLVVELGDHHVTYDLTAGKGRDDGPDWNHPTEPPPGGPLLLIGNIAHAVLPYIPHIVVQIGAAGAPPIALLAAVHGIALAVRAGASGKIYCWAVGAVAVIGIGAFALSFISL